MASWSRLRRRDSPVATNKAIAAARNVAIAAAHAAQVWPLASGHGHIGQPQMATAVQIATPATAIASSRVPQRFDIFFVRK